MHEEIFEYTNNASNLAGPNRGLHQEVQNVDCRSVSIVTAEDCGNYCENLDLEVPEGPSIITILRVTAAIASRKRATLSSGVTDHFSCSL